MAGNLTRILQSLIDRANNGEKAVMTMPNGLKIIVYPERDHNNQRQLVLALVRREIRPSIIEWNTCLKYWPWPVERFTPENFGNNTILGFMPDKPKDIEQVQHFPL